LEFSVKDHFTTDRIDRRSRRRPGFTLPEMLIVIVIIVLIAGMAFPATAKAVRRGRINQAANVVAADLETAVSYAARQRKPIRITHAPGAKSFTIADRATGSPIRSRELGQESEYKVAAVSFSAATVDVFPSGVTSGALTVQVGDGSYTRQIRMTRAGLVQVVQ
jgi:prepilin-type N-terminal cleavage/methylation domain-containing protein